MAYPFFTAESLMVDGPGFAPFGRGHLVSLALCGISVVGLVQAYGAMPRDDGTWGERRRTLATIACAMLLMRLSHDAFCIVAGSFGASWWPLHLCNLCELLCAAYVLMPCDGLGQAVFGLALPSGLLALAFPGWSYCPLLTWASVCGFAEHAAMVSFALALAYGGDVAVRPRRAWVPILVLSCYLCAIFPLNHLLGTNFAFVNWPIAGTPLVPLADRFGNPGYLMPYLGIIVGTIYGQSWLAALLQDRLGLL